MGVTTKKGIELCAMTPEEFEEFRKEMSKTIDRCEQAKQAAARAREEANRAESQRLSMVLHMPESTRNSSTQRRTQLRRCGCPSRFPRL